MLEFIIVPFSNALVFIYSLLGQNFGLAIIVFTILVRLVTTPLTVKQMRSMERMRRLPEVDGSTISRPPTSSS